MIEPFCWDNPLLGKDGYAKSEEFSEKFQRGLVIFNPKIYVADFGSFKRGFMSMELIQKNPKLDINWPRVTRVTIVMDGIGRYWAVLGGTGLYLAVLGCTR